MESYTFISDMLAWMTAIIIPLLTALCAYTYRAKNTLENRMSSLYDMLHTETETVHTALMNYKLEVAQKYASLATLRDLESRLTNHLIRIEKKLDGKYYG